MTPEEVEALRAENTALTSALRSGVAAAMLACQIFLRGQFTSS
jgi:hypothetical protein